VKKGARGCKIKAVNKGLIKLFWGLTQCREFSRMGKHKHEILGG